MSLIDVRIPDIGDFENVPIVEIQVQPGDVVKPEDPLLTLESDKAALEVPAPVGGWVADILVKVGDKVSEGSLILRLETGEAAQDRVPQASPKTTHIPPETKLEPPAPKSGPAERERLEAEHGAAPVAPTATSTQPAPPRSVRVASSKVLAGPAARRLSRELEIDIEQVKATGEKGRVTKEDVKRTFASQVRESSTAIVPIPAVDFSKFGPVEMRPLTRMQRLSGPALHRAWLNVPHVTHADEADITDLDAFRRTLDDQAKVYRVTLLAFLLKASVVALKQYPAINASLAPDKASLILKRYFHLGVAVDTPDGLVVPVVRDVDRKGILELSQELAEVSQRMRDGKIKPADIEGATFTISSLGGIGGTGFTPIVNSPEAAILGVSRAAIKAVWRDNEFKPRLMLPLNLSYDHRIVDGALAARFARRLAEALTDMRQLVL